MNSRHIQYHHMTRSVLFRSNLISYSFHLPVLVGNPPYRQQYGTPRERRRATQAQQTVLGTPSECPAKYGRDARAPRRAQPRPSRARRLPRLPRYATFEYASTAEGYKLPLKVNAKRGIRLSRTYARDPQPDLGLRGPSFEILPAAQPRAR